VSISRDRIEDIAKSYGVWGTSSPLRPNVTYDFGAESIAVRYTTAGNVYAAWHRRADGTSRMIYGGVAAIVERMVEVGDRAAAGQSEPTSLPEKITRDEVARLFGVPPELLAERGTDAFDEIDRADQAAADFERDPQRRGSIGPAHKCPNYSVGIPPRCPDCGRPTPPERISAAGERRPVYAGRPVMPLITVDVIGPSDAPQFELGRWDQAEQAHVHLATLSNSELADLIYEGASALSRTRTTD